MIRRGDVWVGVRQVGCVGRGQTSGGMWVGVR